MKSIISIAARMASTRLPGKVMADVGGKPILQLIVERLSRANAEVVISNNEGDAEIEALANRLGVRYVSGHFNVTTPNGPKCLDMMAMHALTARMTDADIICMAGADDPFLDPALFDLCIDKIVNGDVAFVKTAGWPLGLNVWAWTRSAMEDGNRNATAPDERQHVAPYWERRPLAYPIAVLHRAGEDLYDRFRLTVDGPSDLELVRRVWEHLELEIGWGWDGSNYADRVVGVLEDHPEIAAINADGLHGYAARDAIYDLTPVDADEGPDLESWKRFTPLVDAALLREVRAHVAVERRAALAGVAERGVFAEGQAAAYLSLDQWLQYQERVR